MTSPHHHHAGSEWNLLLGGLLIGLWIGYLLMAYRCQRRQRTWSIWRLISFSGGIGLGLLGLFPEIVGLQLTGIRGHMIQHVLINMLAPIGLVLGAPLNLLLRTLSPQKARVAMVFLRMPMVGYLSHPFSAFALNTGGMYLLYLTPLYRISEHQALLQLLIHTHFFVAGYLFTWAIIGQDPAPHRPPLCTRGIVLFCSIAAHSMLSKAMYAYLWPRASSATMEDIQSAAQLMYYAGAGAELIGVIAFWAIWYQRAGRQRMREPPSARIPQGSTK